MLPLKVTLCCPVRPAKNAGVGDGIRVQEVPFGEDHTPPPPISHISEPDPALNTRLFSEAPPSADPVAPGVHAFPGWLDWHTCNVGVKVTVTVGVAVTVGVGNRQHPLFQVQVPLELVVKAQTCSLNDTAVPVDMSNGLAVFVSVQ